MSGRILVAYASRKGSTAGIAQAIGKELTSEGYAVDVSEMKSVNIARGIQCGCDRSTCVHRKGNR